MAELTLGGCTPTPMASYLKGLGILRLLAEQRPEWSVRGAWRGDSFVLVSCAFTQNIANARDRVIQFFLYDYRPSPIMSPWNGGSGFFYREEKLKEIDLTTGKQKKTGARNQPTVATKTVDAFLRSKCDRLADYRDALRLAKAVLSDLALIEAPKEDQKHVLIKQLRANLPESALPALDAGIALTNERLGFAPLLGSGWNDGNLDFANNFMQRLADIISLETGRPTPSSAAWLKASLSQDAAPELKKGTIGQFYPGRAGGPNASQGFEGTPLVNPWDFVLAFEGALLFTTSTTRRMESADLASLAYPFTVRSTISGTGMLDGGDGGKMREEVWLPLWSQPACLLELRSLFSEGRATLGRRSAKDGLSFARAIAALGVDRGIFAFQRYGFLKRFGNNHLATPLARVQVNENPQARIIEDLESGGFLERLRQFARDEQAPAGIRSHVRRLEDALFDLARGSDRYRLQKVLRIVGRISFDLSKSTKAREAVPRLPRLTLTWVAEADDGSAEFRCAAALAGLDLSIVSLTPFILPVSRDNTRFWQWAPESRTAVWREGRLCENLGRVATRCHLESADRRSAGRPRAVASAADLQRLLAANLDERRLSDLMLGLVLAESAHLPVIHERVALPGAYCALKPFFAPRVQLVKSGFFPEDRTPVLPGEIIANLRAGHTQRAVDIAWRRLRALEVSLPRFPREAPTASGVDGTRLLAALLIPLDVRDLKQCLATLQSPSTRDSDIATGETV